MRTLTVTIFTLCWLLAQLGLAQQAEKVVSPVKERHDSDWYEKQADAWNKEIKKNRKNEEAWENYYRATRYSLEMSGSDKSSTEINTKLGDIIAQMERAIPNTFTFNLMKYVYHAGDLAYGGYMAKAISMRPDDVSRYPDYVAYLMISRNDSLLSKTCRKWYESGEYSPSLMNYSYNELSGMEDKGIIFTNGDASVFSKLLLQHGKGLFKDKKIICLSFLLCDTYVEGLEKELGIPLFSIKKEELNKDYKDWHEAYRAVLNHFIKHTERPVYFSTTFRSADYDFLKDSLYAEGLVFRYSKELYDNMAVTKRNFEEVYLMDYVRETFIPDSYGASVSSFALNYVPCFHSLLAFYKQSGDRNNYTKLYNILHGIIEKTDFESDSVRQSYLDCIDLKDETYTHGD